MELLEKELKDLLNKMKKDTYNKSGISEEFLDNPIYKEINIYIYLK